MNTILKNITDYNNLYWAWEKAKNLYRPGDIWFNELEVAQFEANLSSELALIASEIENGMYQLRPIKPIAYPKKKNEEGPRTRQTFWVSIRDQVTWLATVNIVGGLLDSKMPFWSYGNRLYISMFYDDRSADHAEPKFGYYRNTTRNTFRKWVHSWPLYRRHINLTARFISKKEKEARASLEPREEQILENNEKLSIDHPLNNAYIRKGYWNSSKKEGLFWASLDLEKFYPEINLDTIKHNFFKYLPEEYYSQELEGFINALLIFKLDLNDWNEDDLKEIQLFYGQESYHHLPTGLFIAGFLANVGMMEIDSEVQDKLLKSKNIAHYRYVDDHLILATNFDDLILWILEYHQILAKCNIGTSFNIEKTEPRALATYLNYIENDRLVKKQLDYTDEVETDLKKKAIEETSLNPDFPNPLMTQTLGKVSRIAGTEFNLLTPDEEKSLIADVEHLLITEFPDHELRRDTRVSFAARMLTTMVPKMMMDSSLAYSLHRSVCSKNTLIRTYEKKINSIHDSEEKENLKNEVIKFKEDLRSDEERLKTEHKKLKEEEKRMSLRTVKLLLKAVQDNHDKIRLWSRLMEFLQKTGVGESSGFIEEIKKLVRNKESNDLSVTFIHALVLQVLSSLLLDVIKIQKGNFSFKKKKRALDFAANILNDQVFNYFSSKIDKGSKHYEVVSYQLFRFSAGTVINVLVNNGLDKKKIDLISKFNLIDWTNNPTKFILRTNYSLATWAWWLYTKLPVYFSEKTPLLWNKIAPYLTLENTTDLNVLFLYPAHVPSTVLTKLDELSDRDILDNEGLLFDIFRHLPEGNISNYAIFSKIVKKTENIYKQRTLADWILWTHSIEYESTRAENKLLKFDPRLGEWMALMLIKQVAEVLKNRMEELPASDSKPVSYYKYIHPNNFKFPSKWMEGQEELTWESLRNLLKSGKVDFRSVADFIEDNRYAPNFRNDLENETQAILTALGSLLISLLAKNMDLPSKWNPLGLQQAWLGLAKIKLKDVAVSTFTRDIIDSCFSNRNVETRFHKRLGFVFNYTPDDDTKRDPPSIFDLADFIKYVDFSLSKLTHQQLSVSKHQPRQLTPVSLIRLRHENYQNMMNREDVE